MPNTADIALPPEFVEKMRKLHDSMFPAAFEFDTKIYDNVAKFAHAVIQADREAGRAGRATQDVFVELRALTEALLTRSDDDYLRRQIDSAVEVMAERGCTPPVPWPDKDFGIAVWGRAGDAGGVWVPGKLIRFLEGAAPLNGTWFGDALPDTVGRYWWRKLLRAAAPQPPRVDKSAEAAMVPIGWQFRFVFPGHASNWRSVLELPMSEMRDGDGFKYERRFVYAPLAAAGEQP